MNYEVWANVELGVQYEETCNILQICNKHFRIQYYINGRLISYA